MLGLEAESRLLGHGLSTCATCDGFFFRGHEIAVVGGGDSAVEEATFLTKFATKVTLIHRRDELRASKIMQDRALANPKIELPLELAWSTTLMGDDQARGRRRRATSLTGERSRRSPVTGLFVAIGHRPNTDLFKGQLDMEDNGYLDHPARHRRTPTSTASSPAATCRTTPTARPSPPPAPAAWPPSTPSAGSRPNTTPLTRLSRHAGDPSAECRPAARGWHRP